MAAVARVVYDIEPSYVLDHVVDATRYVETEQKAGNVVLQV